MSIYVLSLRDYEDYQPHWFECDCTKEVFEASVKYAFEKATHLLIGLQQADGFIDGYDLLEEVIKFLEEDGYRIIIPDHEISFHGMCYYSDRSDKPKLIQKKAWGKIIDHNSNVRKEIYAECIK